MSTLEGIIFGFAECDIFAAVKCDICYASDIFRKRNAIYFHFLKKMKM